MLSLMAGYVVTVISSELMLSTVLEQTAASDHNIGFSVSCRAICRWSFVTKGLT